MAGLVQPPSGVGSSHRPGTTAASGQRLGSTGGVCLLQIDRSSDGSCDGTFWKLPWSLQQEAGSCAASPRQTSKLSFCPEDVSNYSQLLFLSGSPVGSYRMCSHRQRAPGAWQRVLNRRDNRELDKVKTKGISVQLMEMMLMSTATITSGSTSFSLLLTATLIQLMLQLNVVANANANTTVREVM